MSKYKGKTIALKGVGKKPVVSDVKPEVKKPTAKSKKVEAPAPTKTNG